MCWEHWHSEKQASSVRKRGDHQCSVRNQQLLSQLIWVKNRHIHRMLRNSKGEEVQSKGPGEGTLEGRIRDPNLEAEQELAR